MKNIAIISTSLNSGGAERIAGLLAKELSRYHNVYLFLQSTEDIVYEYGGTIVDIGKSGPFYEYQIRKYKDLYQIEIAVSFMENMNFANIRTWREREKIIISERCVQSLINPPRISETYKIGKYYDFADAIVACSEGVKHDLVHHYAVNNKIEVIYNFIDKEFIHLSANEGLSGEVEAFLNGEEYFVNVGRLHPQKNQKRVIRQFSYFHERIPGIKLLIIGNGEMKEELISYITELGLNDSIKVVPYSNNPFRYVARAKALILSSRYEGLPNAVLEAMTLGCPVIATDCLSGPRELLLDEIGYEEPLEKIKVGKRGILVCGAASEDEGDSRYMADAMELLCTSAALEEKLKKNGREYMEQYTNQQIVRKWIQVIEESERKEKPDFLEEEERTLKTAEHIVIYGAGQVGKMIFRRFSQRYKIDCFVVSPGNVDEKELLGIPVREISEMEYFPCDTAVIVGVSDNYQSAVLDMLKRYGFTNAVFLYVEPLEENMGIAGIKKGSEEGVL